MHVTLRLPIVAAEQDTVSVAILAQVEKCLRDSGVDKKSVRDVVLVGF